jgi:predicted nucleic acid-binding Zn ribbon protein
MRRSETQSLGKVIKEYLKESRMDGKLAEVEAINSWETIIGKTIARATTNLYIKNGVLYVHLKSSIVRNELFMMRHQIVDAMNKHVGQPVIRQIILR